MRLTSLLSASALLVACSGTASPSFSGLHGDGAADDGSSPPEAGPVLDSGPGPDAGGDDATVGDSGPPPRDGASTDARLDAPRDAPLTCTPSPRDGGACNGLSPLGPRVAVQCSSGPMPTPQGGTITPGVYVMTSAVAYGTCPPPEQDRNTWLVCGSSWQTVQELTTGGQPTTLTTYNLTVSQTATSLQMQIVCGGTASTVTFGYDATPTTFSLYLSGGRVDVYTLQ